MSEEGAGKYREQYTVYADRYGCESTRTIKRWVADGVKAGDRCPLDDPERMREWWARNKSQRCPDKLLAAAVAARKAAGGMESGPQPVPGPVKAPVQDPLMELPMQPVKEKSASPPLVPRELRPVSAEEVGLEATLRRLQEAEVLAHRIYKEALEEGNDAKAKLSQKAFTDLALQVSRVETMVIEQRKQTRDLLPRLEVEVAIADFHQGISTVMRGRGDSVIRALGLPVTPANLAIWEAEMEATCEQLQEEVFAAP